MATRQKKKIISNVTKEAADDAFASYNKCYSKLEQIQGELNNEVTKVKERYESRIAKLQQEKEEQFEILEAYAHEHTELFEKKKSIDTIHGILGFRTGTPKLKTLKGFTWEKVKNLVKHILPGYIRIEEEIAKDLILIDREKPDVKDKMKDLGIEVVQDETFFVTPKLEEVVNA